MKRLASELSLREVEVNDIAILKYWDSLKHVIDANPNEEWNWEEEINDNSEWKQQLIAEVNNKPIGFLQIIDPYLEESHYWGEVDKNLRAIDIWIGEPDYLNKGYGSQMMCMAFELCFEVKKVKGILIDPLESNGDAIRFYRRLGFEFLEKRNFNGDICDVYFLSRNVYENKR